MKIALFDNYRLGLVDGEWIRDITDATHFNPERAQESLVSLMQEDTLRAAPLGPRLPLSEVRLRAPVPHPYNIIAAPVNYRRHQTEMNEQFNNAAYTVEGLGFFLKSPSSIIGPEDTVFLPFRDRRVDHEAELAFVIGRTAKDVSIEDAQHYIFGYLALMDVTVRGIEDRPMRKSFDTFTPMGPWIVTADEVGNPHNLDIALRVNEEIRQSANTRDLIYDCYRFLSFVSHVMTLSPGDVVTTGTPEGVGPLFPGDRVTISIERVGEFSVHVAYKPGI